LELNGKSENGDYPLYWAYENNNIEMLELLIDYADKNNIILYINEKDENGNNPLYWAFRCLL